MSGDKYKSFQDNLGALLLDNSPTVSNFPFSELWSFKQGVETLYNCSVFLFGSSQYLSTHIFARPYHIVCPTRPCVPVVSSTLVFFSCCQQKLVIRTFLCGGQQDLVRFAFTLSACQVYVVKKRCWLNRINKFHKFLPHGSHVLLSSRHFDVIHVNR